jgi:hypothetical protein
MNPYPKELSGQTIELSVCYRTLLEKFIDFLFRKFFVLHATRDLAVALVDHRCR